MSTLLRLMNRTSVSAAQNALMIDCLFVSVALVKNVCLMKKANVMLKFIDLLISSAFFLAKDIWMKCSSALLLKI